MGFTYVYTFFYLKTITTKHTNHTKKNTKEEKTRREESRQTKEMKLNYVIKYVADMDKAVGFYRDALGFELRMQYPGWTEFATGETTLALHPASDEHPAGSASLGLGVDDLDDFYSKASNAGIEFTAEPTDIHGHRIARFKDSEGAECSVSGKV